MSIREKTSERDRIPLAHKAAFSAGFAIDYLASGLTISLLWMPFFNIGLGMSPTLLGLILMILRGWDAFTDPIMGNLSDNARTRWGRRRPFIALGAVLTSASYVALWHIPAFAAEENRVAALIGTGVLFYTCFTIWSVPFYSLQMELTPDYDERTRLAAWVSVAGKLVSLAGGWVLAFATCSWFADPGTGKPDLVRGMQATSWLIGGVILVAGLTTAAVVKERYFETAKKRVRIPFWKSLRESAGCGPLWCLIGVTFFLILGASIGNKLAQYVSIYVLFHGDIAAASVLSGWRSTAVMVIGIGLVPVFTWLSGRMEKRTLVMWLLAASVGGHLLNLFFLRPGQPYLWFVPVLFESAAIGAVWLFVPSMKGDVADYDETVTSARREGSLNAFASWFSKAASTAAAGLGGVFVELTGFDAKLGDQPVEVLTRMKWLYLLLPLIPWCLALICIWRYPLSRARMGGIRAELEARRGKV